MIGSSVWASADSVQVGVNTGAWHAVTSANLVVQLTLLLLVFMSVMSWAIIFRKRKEFLRADENNLPFEETFWKSQSLDLVYDSVKEFPESSMAHVFRAGYQELRKMADSPLTADQAAKSDDSRRIFIAGLDNLQRAVNKSIDMEVGRLESRLSFLATVGSVGPFVGLFGTVWGIMGSFQQIGATGVASLAVVAPGIAEALIATGVGLFAAIPATVAYNYFVTQTKKHELTLNNFASDFLNIVKRNFFRG